MFFNHPGWIEANADHVRTALDQLGTGTDVHLAFTAHSIPVAMARACRYEDQLRESARLVAEAVGVTDTALVYQSRSGPPQVPWLEPDILDHLRAVAARGVTDVVISPIGFVSDHLEVLFDLDVEAVRDRCRARAEPRSRGERGNPPCLRRDDPRADRGAARPHLGASRRRPVHSEPRHLPRRTAACRAPAGRAPGPPSRRSSPVPEPSSSSALPRRGR